LRHVEIAGKGKRGEEMGGNGVRLPVDNQVGEQILEYFDWALFETGGRKTKNFSLFDLFVRG
jgi:hypothetical protein